MFGSVNHASGGPLHLASAARPGRGGRAAPWRGAEPVGRPYNSGANCKTPAGRVAKAAVQRVKAPKRARLKITPEVVFGGK